MMLARGPLRYHALMDKRVGVRLRSCALLVDGVVILVMWFGLSVLTQRVAMGYGGMPMLSGKGYVGLWFFMLLTPPLAVLMYAGCDAYFAATLGKSLLKLRIADETGRRATRGQLLARFAVKYASLIVLAVWIAFFSVHVAVSNGRGLNDVVRLTPFVLGFAGLLLLIAGFGGLMALRAPRQALHDRLTRTAVYRAADVTTSFFEPVFSAPPTAGMGRCIGSGNNLQRAAF